MFIEQMWRRNGGRYLETKILVSDTVKQNLSVEGNGNEPKNENSSLFKMFKLILVGF